MSLKDIVFTYARSHQIYQMEGEEEWASGISQYRCWTKRNPWFRPLHELQSSTGLSDDWKSFWSDYVYLDRILRFLQRDLGLMIEKQVVSDYMWKDRVKTRRARQSAYYALEGIIREGVNRAVESITAAGTSAQNYSGRTFEDAFRELGSLVESVEGNKKSEGADWRRDGNLSGFYGRVISYIEKPKPAGLKTNLGLITH